MTTSIELSAEVPDNIVEAIRKLIRSLRKRGIRVEKVLLFGSYAKGTWIKTSDIDLIIVSKDFKDIPFKDRLDIINEIVFKEGIEPYIEALPYTPEEFAVKIRRSIVLRDASKYWIDLSYTLYED